MMAILLSGLWEAEQVVCILALVVLEAAWVQWCLALDCQEYKSPKALVSQVVVVERVARRVVVAARVALAQVVCMLALVESPVVLAVVSGMWKRRNLDRMPGRV